MRGKRTAAQASTAPLHGAAVIVATAVLHAGLRRAAHYAVRSRTGGHAVGLRDWDPWDAFEGGAKEVRIITVATPLKLHHVVTGRALRNVSVFGDAAVVAPVRAGVRND
jgi:hypothetical protein